MILRQGVRFIALGWLLGLAASLVLAHSISSLLFGIASTDLTAFAVASVVVGVSALAGCLLPTIRAARVDPVVALRSD